MSTKNTEKENQHYVPKFYLRFFSFENNEKQIGIFNKNTGFYLKTAKLKTQGSKKYLYGKDGLVEDFLGDVENHLTPILKTIIRTEQLPEMFSVTCKLPLNRTAYNSKITLFILFFIPLGLAPKE